MYKFDITYDWSVESPTIEFSNYGDSVCFRCFLRNDRHVEGYAFYFEEPDGRVIIFEDWSADSDNR